MDQKSEQLLSLYRKQVEQTARKVYLDAKAIAREINESKLNQEDRDRIRLHIISIISEVSIEN